MHYIGPIYVFSVRFFTFYWQLDARALIPGHNNSLKYILTLTCYVLHPQLPSLVLLRVYMGISTSIEILVRQLMFDFEQVKNRSSRAVIRAVCDVDKTGCCVCYRLNDVVICKEWPPLLCNLAVSSFRDGRNAHFQAPSKYRVLPILLNKVSIDIADDTVNGFGLKF